MAVTSKMFIQGMRQLAAGVTLITAQHEGHRAGMTATAEAIRAGVRLLGNGDVLLISGKGHETGQIIGSIVKPFSDHEAVRAALAEAPLNA